MCYKRSLGISLVVRGNAVRQESSRQRDPGKAIWSPAPRLEPVGCSALSALPEQHR